MTFKKHRFFPLRHHLDILVKIINSLLPFFHFVTLIFFVCALVSSLSENILFASIKYTSVLHNVLFIEAVLCSTFVLLELDQSHKPKVFIFIFVVKGKLKNSREEHESFFSSMEY